MSKMLVISDLHAHNHSRFSTTLPDGTNSRLADLIDVLSQVEQYIAEHQVHTLAILGDLTHRRNYVSFSVYTKLCEWLRRVQNTTRVIALVGNHDIESRGHHSLAPLAYQGVTVIDSPTWVEIEDQGSAYFVPYVGDDSIIASLQEHGNPLLVECQERRVFLHYALNGKILDNEYAVPSVLTREHVAAFDRVTLGHVHSPSLEDNGRITYVGAPLHFDFGDDGSRYAWLYGPEGPPVALPLYAPRFVTVTYPRIPVPPDHYSGFLRVLGAPRALLPDIRKSATDAGWLDAVVIEASLPAEAIRTLSAAVAVDEQLIREHVAQRYPQVDDVTRVAIVDFALSCVREAGQ